MAGWLVVFAAFSWIASFFSLFFCGWGWGGCGGGGFKMFRCFVCMRCNGNAMGKGKEISSRLHSLHSTFFFLLLRTWRYLLCWSFCFFCTIFRFFFSSFFLPWWCVGLVCVFKPSFMEWDGGFTLLGLGAEIWGGYM